jgi:hypothetical protein
MPATNTDADATTGCDDRMRRPDADATTECDDRMRRPMQM